ncbi:MAG TPA: hypothetical protein VF509_15005 [Sphingobium sp.]
MLIRLIDNMLLTERSFSPSGLANPQIAALLVSVIVPGTIGLIVGPMILGSNGAVLFGLLGLAIGVMLFAWRVAKLASHARFDEDRAYDEKTRLRLSKEYRDTHSASYRGEK